MGANGKPSGPSTSFSSASMLRASSAGVVGGGGDDIDGGVFLLQPQRCAPLNKYNGGDGREEAPRGQIVGGIKRERCVEGRRLRAMGGGGGGRQRRRRLWNNYFTWLLTGNIEFLAVS